MAFRAPLLGYNTNVRHKGKLYHIQTEDSGVDHPHVITHLFADGGRIVASKKTSYADRVGSEGLPDQVKKLMQGQHKAMFISLRDGIYDEDASDDTAPEATTGTRGLAPKPASPVVTAPSATSPDTGSTKLDGASAVEPAPEPALEPAVGAAASRSSIPTEVVPAGDSVSSERAPLYQSTQAALRVPAEALDELSASKQASGSRSLFGADLLSDKSLDEVILNYLAANEKDGV